MPERPQAEHLAPQGLDGKEACTGARAVVDRLIHPAGNVTLLPARVNQSAGAMRAQAKAHAFAGWADEHPRIGDFVAQGEKAGA